MTGKKKATEANATGTDKKTTRAQAADSAEAATVSKAVKRPKKVATASPKARNTADRAEASGRVATPAGTTRTNLDREEKVSKAAQSKGSRAAKAGRVITAQERWQMISENAYYRAERRGFLGGNTGEDWIASEAEIDAELVRTNTVVKP